jgi:drug/metabolite transporter (DMT)-like permease
MSTVSFQYLGETLAIINSIVWAFVVILFKISGLQISPTSLNIFKITIGLILMIFTLLAIQHPFFPPLDTHDYVLLAISGILGIGISDTLFFQSLNMLGASRSAIVDCLYSPFIIMFSFIFLGERLTALNTIGALLVISSVVVVSSRKKDDPISKHNLLLGVLCGAISMGSMGFGIVIIKPLLSGLSVVWVSVIRMFFGVASLALYSFFTKDCKKTWSIFLPQPIWKVALPACLLGSYVTMLLWVGSFKFASANVAGILTQLSVVFTVLFANFFLKEPLTRRKILSVFLALIGTVLVMV